MRSVKCYKAAVSVSAMLSQLSIITSRATSTMPDLTSRTIACIARLTTTTRKRLSERLIQLITQHTLVSLHPCARKPSYGLPFHGSKQILTWLNRSLYRRGFSYNPKLLIDSMNIWKNFYQYV